MIFIERVIGRQFMQQYHQTVFSLLIQLDSYLRRLIPKYSRIPRKYEFFWALNFQILTCVNEDASVPGLRINPKGSPNHGIKFNMHNIGVAWTHPAPQTIGIEPHVEDLFA